MFAFNVVPEAVAKPNHAVDVPPVNVRLATRAFVAKRLVEVVFVPVAFVQLSPATVSGFETVRLVKVAFVAKRLVEVVFVPVAFVQLRPESVKGFATRRFVKDPVVAKRLVDVEFVVVAFVAVRPPTIFKTFPALSQLKAAASYVRPVLSLNRTAPLLSKVVFVKNVCSACVK